MSRQSLLLLVGLSLALGGCRAKDEQCRELARHIVEVADAEGTHSRAGMAGALEDECNAVRPTKRLVDCMMKAQTLAEIDAC
jgi:hypothetical protein